MIDNYYALILAGGGGTRLWPMSRKAKPKQLLKLIDDRTMFKLSVDRLAPIFPPERIIIVTGSQYVEQMQAETPQIPAENFIVEPFGRDSGPAAALGIAMIYKRNPNATIAQLTVDHYIGKEKDFIHLLDAAYQVAQDGYIVTLGISPSHPATGYGYIRQGDEIRQINGFTAYHTRGFTEKPSLVAATSFVASGQYSWNSGMFIWKADRAMEEFEHQQPEIFSLLKELMPSMDTPAFHETLVSVWDRMKSISIDYAIMESAKQMAVIPADIGWNDVGSWASLYDIHPADKFGNVFKGKSPERVILDTEKTLVYSDRLTVTIGVEDIIIVDTDDVLLICHRERAQDVRDVVNHLRSIKRDEYL
ncbi:MAG: mannose-1-phosphate guanylyltransferase [Phototrophicales bacterium]